MAEFCVVLLVEGAAETRELAARALREHGYLVAQVTDAESALEFMRHVVVDVLFTDVLVLGSLGGVELARAARRRNPAVRILCAADTEIASGDAAAQLCERLLHKPYRPAQLAAEIRLLLRAN